MDNQIRYHFVDFIRGIAVILMIFFHLFYDLNIFGFVSIDFQKDFFWYWLPRLIVLLFMFSVGVSLCLAHSKEIHLKAYMKRLLKIGLGAIIISISTYFMYPNAWIYFGTLHCIFFTTILITPFVNKPTLALILAIIILALDLTPYRIPFWELKHASLDYIPLFPWSAISLIGIYTYKLGIHKFSLPTHKAVRFTNTLGQNAFKIYILHQPILFSLVYLVRFSWPSQS